MKKQKIENNGELGILMEYVLFKKYYEKEFGKEYPHEEEKEELLKRFEIDSFLEEAERIIERFERIGLFNL